jgi:lipoate-protein ligase B
MAAVWLGRVDYAGAWELQRTLVDLRAAGRIPDLLLLLEHPRTLTMGRRYREEHLLVPRETLLARGFALFDVDRGGDVTYHGPGQLVGYPIFDLNDHGRDLHLYIRKVEEALIRALSTLGIRGIRHPPHTGVWVEDRKIAAIGIKVSRWIASHGFALNVSTDLEDFRTIVPCGIHDSAVTSVHFESGRGIRIEEMIPPIIAGFDSVFEFAGGPVMEAEWPALEVESGGAASDSAKILRQGIDARKIGVIDYAPLSGGSDFPGIRVEEI